MSFTELTSICKNIANELHTMVDVNDYSHYGWQNISFMTDAFGGTYINLHYDNNTGVVTNWYGSEHARVIETIDQLKVMVKYYMKKMLKERNMEYISERINDEY